MQGVKEVQSIPPMDEKLISWSEIHDTDKLVRMRNPGFCMFRLLSDFTAVSFDDLGVYRIDGKEENYANR